MGMVKDMRARYGTRAANKGEGKPASPPVKKRSAHRRWVAWVVILWIVLLLGGMVAMKLAYKVLSVKRFERLEDARFEDMGIGHMVCMDEPVRVNLISGSGKPRSAEVQVALEVRGRDNMIIVGQQMPVFKNAIIQIVGSHTVADCLSVEGKQKIKQKILGALPATLEDRVINLFFLKLIVT